MLPVHFWAFSRAVFKLSTSLCNAKIVWLKIVPRWTRWMTWRSSCSTRWLSWTMLVSSAIQIWQYNAKIKVHCKVFMLNLILVLWLWTQKWSEHSYTASLFIYHPNVWNLVPWAFPMFAICCFCPTYSLDHISSFWIGCSSITYLPQLTAWFMSPLTQASTNLNE
jgi:hypothetical protein